VSRSGERNNTSDGAVPPLSANIVAKSLSAETIVCPCSTANAAIVSSEAATSP
jgi:hypothetical protein